MKIHTRATCLASNGAATLEPPEGAANVTATHVVLNNNLWQVVTWIELSPSERAEAMMQNARRVVQ